MLVVMTSNTSWYLFNFRSNTIKALIRNGYSVLAVAPFDAYSARLRDLGCKFSHVPIDQGGTNPFYDILTFFCFLYTYKKYHPDIVLNFTSKNNIYSTLAAFLLKIPCVNNISGLGFLFVNECFSSKVASLLYRLTQSKAKKIFFQNNDDLRYFLQKKLAPTGVVEKISGSGVDLNRFTVVPKKDFDSINFILIARMIYDKGIKEYVESSKYIKEKYSNVNFFLLGFIDSNNPSCIRKDTIDEWVSQGLINYLGCSDCVENEISNVDCVVLPSYYREGIPRSLLEAAAMGKPIVTTNTVGCREVVDDGVTGFLCEPRSVSDLCLKLEKIIQMSPEERLAMGLRGRRKIEKQFDENIVIHKYLSEIDRLTSPQKKPQLMPH